MGCDLGKGALVDPRPVGHPVTGGLSLPYSCRPLDPPSGHWIRQEGVSQGRQLTAP